jgi:glycosyltransferase involved in cell wall biosynthesis
VHHLVIVQHGDYGEAFDRFQAGGPENYFAQRHSVNFVAGLQDRNRQVSVVCVTSDPYDRVLTGGVRAIGMRLATEGFDALVGLLRRLEPTEVIVASPMLEVIRSCNRWGVRLLPVFADSFQRRWPRGVLYRRGLVRELNRDCVPVVANHHLNAARNLAEIGVNPAKVVPWDWPVSRPASPLEPKSLEDRGAPYQIGYVGAIKREKGVHDCIEAVAHLRGQLDVRLEIAGGGDRAGAEALMERLGVAQRVRFLGTIPNTDVPAFLRSRDVLVVPSRHEYPEGLPLSLREALLSRTPLVASDHPMFRGRVVHEESGLVFRAGRPRELAAAIRRVLTEPSLYTRLSGNAIAAWDRLLIPLRWEMLLGRWLSGRAEDLDWLLSHSLARYGYS